MVWCGVWVDVKSRRRARRRDGEFEYGVRICIVVGE